MNPEKPGSASPCLALLPMKSPPKPALALDEGVGPERAAGGEGGEAGADAPSPCIKVCNIDAASGLCEGCQRNIEEITSWSSYSAAQKRALLALLPSRKRAQ